MLPKLGKLTAGQRGGSVRIRRGSRNNCSSIESARTQGSELTAGLAFREIAIYGIDSHVSRFAVSDPQAARRLLERIQPSRIFSKRSLVINGSTTTTLFPGDAIVRVDFVMDGYPDWHFHNHVSDVVEITEAELKERLQPTGRTNLLGPRRGEPTIVFADITLGNAERIYVQCTMNASEPPDDEFWRMTPLDNSLLAQHILAEPSLYIRRRGGGAILLNSAHVVRVNLYSGPADIPDAWPADLL